MLNLSSAIPTVLNLERNKLNMSFNYSQSRSQRTVPSDFAPFQVRRYGRHWEVRDAAGELVCLTVYRRGAAEVIRRLKLTVEHTEVRGRC